MMKTFTVCERHCETPCIACPCQNQKSPEKTKPAPEQLTITVSIGSLVSGLVILAVLFLS